MPSYRRICEEFGIDSLSNFLFTHGKNHGLGNVYVYAQGATKTEYDYPGWNKFSDEGCKAIKENLIYYIEPDVCSQYGWFSLKTASGLIQAGFARVLKSVNRGVCLLHLGGPSKYMRQYYRNRQKGKRSSLWQSDFLVLMEDATRQPDLAQSVQR